MYAVSYTLTISSARHPEVVVLGGPLTPLLLPPQGLQGREDDLVGQEEALGGQAPPAVLLHRPAPGPEGLQSLGNGGEGQAEPALKLLPPDAPGGPQAQHQILRVPVPGRDALALRQYALPGLHPTAEGLQ